MKEPGCALPRGAAAGPTLRWIESGPKTQDYTPTRVKVVRYGIGVHVAGWVSRSPLRKINQIPENHSSLFGG
eukprot:6644867-Prymnesium_polylepis.1